jgi:hypothetical protein
MVASKLELHKKTHQIIEFHDVIVLDLNIAEMLLAGC